MIKYPHLFSAGKIGELALKNKVIMPAMGTSLSSMTGELTPNIIEYYRERAKGGVGLIIVEVSEINYENGNAALNSVRMDTPRCIPQLRRLTDEVHVYGTKLFVQLHHGGNQASKFVNENNQTVSASDVKSDAIPDRPRALTTEEVQEYVQRYIASALYAKMSNCDGIEIHGAHGYLVAQFLSAHTNRRTDQYGGSFENRMRFAVEIIQGIKAVCGPKFPVCIRLSIDEYTSHGYDLEEGVRIAKAMEEAGADAIHASMGNYESYPATIGPCGFAQGWRVYMAEAVKKQVDIPVIAVGTLREPDFAEKVLEENRADFVAIGRGHIADPEWCNKAMSGRETQIRKCISCMTCVNKVLSGGYVSCAINARAGHEFEFGKLKKDGNGRKVVVVGGGPGGMEAARICAERGFSVVLFEDGDKLGGQLQLANKSLNKEKINWFIEYGTFELNRLGVDVRLNCKADAEMIRTEKPHAVFIATGGTPIIPNVTGATEPIVTTAEDYLSGKVEIENANVVVIGGGVTGAETAALVASKGNKTSIVEMIDSICCDIYPDSRIEILNCLQEYQVDIHTNAMLWQIQKDGVLVEDLEKGGMKNLQADKVIIAIGVKPVNTLYQEIMGEYDNLCVLGDAMKQGKIIDAIYTAHVRAWELE